MTHGCLAQRAETQPINTQTSAVITHDTCQRIYPIRSTIPTTRQGQGCVHVVCPNYRLGRGGGQRRISPRANRLEAVRCECLDAFARSDWLVGESKVFAGEEGRGRASAGASSFVPQLDPCSFARHAVLLRVSIVLCCTC